MEVGFLPDSTYGGVVELMWLRGAPQHDKVFGIKTSTLKYDGHEAGAVTAYRCLDCGFLKLCVPRVGD
jgi:hypothetical protein